MCSKLAEEQEKKESSAIGNMATGEGATAVKLYEKFLAAASEAGDEKVRDSCRSRMNESKPR